MKSQYDSKAANTPVANSNELLVSDATGRQKISLSVEEATIDHEHVSYERYAEVASEEFHLLMQRLTAQTKLDKNDFNGVSRIVYDASHTYALTLVVHPIFGNFVGEAAPYTRANVIKSIQAGAKFSMLQKDDDGMWSYGPRIFVVVVNGIEYLKTGIDNENADRLNFNSLA